MIPENACFQWECRHGSHKVRTGRRDLEDNEKFGHGQQQQWDDDLEEEGSFRLESVIHSADQQGPEVLQDEPISLQKVRLLKV